METPKWNHWRFNKTCGPLAGNPLNRPRGSTGMIEKNWRGKMQHFHTNAVTCMHNSVCIFVYIYISWIQMTCTQVYIQFIWFCIHMYLQSHTYTYIIYSIRITSPAGHPPVQAEARLGQCEALNIHICVEVQCSCSTEFNLVHLTQQFPGFCCCCFSGWVDINQNYNSG